MPFGAPNKFEEAVTRIKGAKPDAVDRTLVGADNVNFNRTFAGFGLDKTIARLSLLLEENTLLGIGAENSGNLYSCMGYFANSPSEGAKKFKAAYIAKYGDKAPQLATIGADCYSALNLAKALFDKAGGADAKKLDRRVRGAAVRQRLGPRDDARPPGRQGHVPRDLQGHRVRGHQDHQGASRAAPPAAREA